MAANKHDVRGFFLDPLVASANPQVRKIGHEMAGLLLARVPDVELSDIVHNTNAIHSIHMEMLKMVINSQLDIKKRLTTHDSMFADIERTFGDEISKPDKWRDTKSAQLQLVSTLPHLTRKMADLEVKMNELVV